MHFKRNSVAHFVGEALERFAESAEASLKGREGGDGNGWGRDWDVESL